MSRRLPERSKPLLITGPVRSRLHIHQRDPAAERGLTSVEYALMAALVVVLLVGGTYYLFQSVQDRFSRNESCASVAYRGARGGGC
jgi:Flp pilus assembly pilin Flp